MTAPVKTAPVETGPGKNAVRQWAVLAAGAISAALLVAASPVAGAPLFGEPVSQISRDDNAADSPDPSDRAPNALTVRQSADAADEAQLAQAIVTDARLMGDARQTVFEFDVTNKIDFDAFLLDSPPRVVIDMPAVEFRLTGDEIEKKGLIEAWRKGLFAPGQSRIVIDVSGPVKIETAAFVDASGSRPARINLALAPAEAREFEAAVREGQLARQAKRSSAGRKGDRLTVKNSSSNKPLVVLDPGHGGLDRGTVGDNGALEKEVVLDFALALRDALERTDAYTVRLTRDTDVFVPLDKRVQFARDHGADLFVSLHADSVRQNYVRGASVYTVSKRASDDIARELAENENKSDMLAGVVIEDAEDVVADILVDLMRRETKAFSVRFADTIVDQMRPRMRLVSNPHRYAGFRVLRAPDVPSVLVELGFLSNKDDEELLTSEEWREDAILSLHMSIDRFFGVSTAHSGG